MIEVNYNEYKETIAQNMKLVVENHDLKEKIESLNNIINELERRFNQELENNEKYDIEDTKEFYSKKWVRDTLNDFINMIKELKGDGSNEIVK